MNIPNAYPDPENNADELLRTARERVLNAAGGLYWTAQWLQEAGTGTYISREPLAVAGNDRMWGVLLTHDGVRPYIDEPKDYVKLLFDEQPLETSAPGTVWVEEWRDGEQRPFLVLTEHGLQPHADTLEELTEDLYSIQSSSETDQLRRLKERINRFQLTRIHDEPVDSVA